MRIFYAMKLAGSNVNLTTLIQIQVFFTLTQMIDTNLHLKAVSCFHIRTHHDTGIIDEDVQVIYL